MKEQTSEALHCFGGLLYGAIAGSYSVLKVVGAVGQCQWVGYSEAKAKCVDLLSL